MAGLTPVASLPRAAPADGRRLARDSLVVALGGQVERLVGMATALALRWGLDPARLGVYTGLRLYLDNTNRSSLGVGLGAVQEIPVLRAAGRAAEAQHVADVAHTTNTLTCLAYAAALLLLAWLGAPGRAGDPLAAEWTWGLAATAGLALIRRHESFLIAVLRAYGEFALTTRLDVVEACVSAPAVILGLLVAGFWGLLAAVAVILLAKIAYLHARHPLRFGWAWDLPLAWRLMRSGLPILANTAAFGAVVGLDRALVLGLMPDGARAAGLYSVALLGTSWSLDLAGRLVLVLYQHLQTALGRTGDPAEVCRRAARAAEAQGPALGAGAAVAYLLAPEALARLMPRYAEGLAALRPLMPGMVLLGLAWPARQALITVGRPVRLGLATLLGLALLAEAGAIGAVQGGLIGLAWGMSFGYLGVYLATSAAAFAPALGPRGWLAHQGRLAAGMLPFAFGALAATQAPLPIDGRPAALAARSLMLAALAGPSLMRWGRRHAWAGLFARRGCST